MPDGSPITYVVFGVSIIAAWTVTLVALKNWRGNRYLCDDCLFNKDGDCLKVERPKAVSCTAYRSEKQRDYRI
jgi:hypothetical protein